MAANNINSLLLQQRIGTKMAYLERLLRLSCCSNEVAFIWKRSAVAVPKLRTDSNDGLTLGFSKPERWPRINMQSNRLDLVIKSAPEDGWYIAKPDGLLKSYLQVRFLKRRCLSSIYS